jgi:hypothetical protein
MVSSETDVLVHQVLALWLHDAEHWPLVEQSEVHLFLDHPASYLEVVDVALTIVTVVAAALSNLKDEVFGYHGRLITPQIDLHRFIYVTAHQTKARPGIKQLFILLRRPKMFSRTPFSLDPPSQHTF